MSDRQEKVRKLIKEEVAKELLLLGLPYMVTVRDVFLTGDLKNAEVWVSILNGDETQVLEDLNKNRFNIQRIINSKIVMKFIPKIVFKIDHSGEYVEKIDNIFKTIEDE
ncbi:hypothetical protein AUK11_03145 [bacterium CG2_30_37_16]|nr:MAG: hypothetical protein AUK11_03145 [bacterium CG2_30_37_16]PIP30224.1 MAG: hypothetical protein COX25_05735 [bacterium (Candidatus Howlettbacteria) CG23_combo_of_CG06-09_8_20_14_all_37_9]PIY00198.1 MAG: hypothetical protein COZ22_00860 [bacterium (Candidatus Howlettbacteria) CG_4_10_14_3_um_filter_37_10]PJB07246.1 MAG: hypothetical protein CO123_00630 [bacterium (Candidatus Howlettbacteria) CG_4_9_14_3_um_filter_37_10]